MNLWIFELEKDKYFYHDREKNFLTPTNSCGISRFFQFELFFWPNFQIRIKGLRWKILANYIECHKPSKEGKFIDISNSKLKLSDWSGSSCLQTNWEKLKNLRKMIFYLSSDILWFISHFWHCVFSKWLLLFIVIIFSIIYWYFIYQILYFWSIFIVNYDLIHLENK